MTKIIKSCECGCGKSFPLLDVYGRPRRFVHGHVFRTKNQTGEKNHMWKGGITMDSEYVKLRRNNHPNHDSHGCVRKHRLIYENYLSILLDEDVFIPMDYDIHHINGNKRDNSLVNLEFLSHSQHIKFHQTGKIKDCSDRFCVICKSKETFIMKSGRPLWYISENGFICKKCYKRKMGDSRR
jgi:hypothetical protein